jgi:hypothetical protein
MAFEITMKTIHRKPDSARSALQQLSRLHGVQTSYLDMNQRRRDASTESLLAVLRALGVGVERLRDVPAALREGRLARASRVVEPIHVVWQGQRAAVPSDARWMLVNLEDLWLETESQNTPCTSTERVNWRCKLRLSLEQMNEHPRGGKSSESCAMHDDRIPSFSVSLRDTWGSRPSTAVGIAGKLGWLARANRNRESEVRNLQGRRHEWWMVCAFSGTPIASGLSELRLLPAFGNGTSDANAARTDGANHDEQHR